MTTFEFATCERWRALEFIQRVYPGRDDIVDSPESAGPLLDFVEKDIVRIQDPMMHGDSPQVSPGRNWDEEHRDAVVAACEIFHTEPEEKL